MRVLPLLLLLAPWATAAGTPPERLPINVNSRYVVESVDVEADDQSRVSQSLRDEMKRLVGERLDPAQLTRLARRVRKELNARRVTQKLLRGSQPDRVRVSLAVEQRQRDFDLSAPKLVYHSRLGWTAALEGVQTFGDNRVAFGLQTDADQLLERYSGIQGRYERLAFGTDRIRFRVDVQSTHQQWNAPTLRELTQRPDLPGIYRNRTGVEPVLTLGLFSGLTLRAGTSFQSFETQFPVARTESANALITSLRYDRRWTPLGTAKHHLDAGYDLRAATRSLDSDFAYSRHALGAEYTWDGAATSLTLRASGGLLNGRAPLFERFTLGNSRTLRGWNKFDLAPVGGDRFAHASVEVRRNGFLVLYDAGTVFDRDEGRTIRHSAGAGFQQGSFLLAVAFPVRSYRLTPVFIVGFAY